MDLLASFLFLVPTFVAISCYTINVDQNRITCWTCPNKGSNLECNDWAPDRYCPQDQSVCRTVHTFSDVTGQIASVRVDKMCVHPEQCTRQTVGCKTDKTTNTKTCVSCCTTSYCNQKVAHDNHTAIKLSVTLLGSASSGNELSYWLIFIMVHLTMLTTENSAKSVC